MNDLDVIEEIRKEIGVPFHRMTLEELNTGSRASRSNTLAPSRLGLSHFKIHSPSHMHSEVQLENKIKSG